MMSRKIKHPLRRTAALSLMLVMLAVQMITCASCGGSKSDDAAMTESLLDAYMESFRDYNFAGINKCCMARLEGYDDGEEAFKACKLLASRVKWKCDSISIHGNSAMAQVSLTLPADFGEICDLALGDLMKSIDGGADGNPAELLTSAIRKRAAKAEITEVSAEISMTKVNNKWYIVQSLGVNRVITDIRTPVAYAYSMIGS